MPDGHLTSLCKSELFVLRAQFKLDFISLVSGRYLGCATLSIFRFAACHHSSLCLCPPAPGGRPAHWCIETCLKPGPTFAALCGGRERERPENAAELSCSANMLSMSCWWILLFFCQKQMSVKKLNLLSSWLRLESYVVIEYFDVTTLQMCTFKVTDREHSHGETRRSQKIDPQCC